MKSVIYVKTTNQNKVEEYKKIFGNYGIHIEVVNKDLNVKEMIELLKNTTTYKPIAIIREYSNLYIKDSNVIKNNFNHLDVVDNTAVLEVHGILNGQRVYRAYKHTIEGFIDLNREKNTENVFGWDDIFVPSSTLITLQEMKEKGLKISSRDMVISYFIKEFIHYKERVDLNYNPQKPQKTVDFQNRVLTFFENNTYLNLPELKEYHLNRLFKQVIKNGLFFKSAKNRKEKNYWLPSLNAGLPLVPKKDEIHEITFMTHDMMHFLIPDLLYTGEDGLLAKKVYIIYRMMSEAFTLVLADMLFIDGLNKSGIQYDYTKRNIYPLFQSLELDFKNNFEDSLRLLFKANVDFALSGDIKLYKALIKNENGHIALEAFVDKYKPFFVEDYKWTEQNYKNMQSEQGSLSKWFDKHHLGVQEIQVESISSFIKKLNITNTELSNDDLIELIFEEILQSMILSNMKSEVQIDPVKSNQRAFRKYMYGQMVIFSKFDFLPDSIVYENLISRELQKDITVECMERIISLYKQYIELLKNKNIISWDDMETYQEMYTIFPPFYVSYDNDKEEYEPILTIRERVLNA